MNFKDKKIAVLGASQDHSKYGHKIFKDLDLNGYTVWPINPKGGLLLGKMVYKSLSELPSKPDLVITVVAPSETEKAVEECNNLGIKHIWMQPGSESQKAIEKAKKYGIEITSACFMVKNKIWE